MHPIIYDLLNGFVEIFKSPSNDWSVFWLIAPILLFWLMLEIYFDRHKKEELGWNTALGNGLSLFWVAISCVKFIVGENFTFESFWRTFWIFIIFSYSLFIIWISFTHRLKKNIVYLLASPTPIYFLSIMIVLLSYGVLEFSWIILVDLSILYLLILGIEVLVRRYTPEVQHKDESSFSNEFDQINHPSMQNNGPFN